MSDEKLKIIGLQVQGIRKLKAFIMGFNEKGMIVFSGKNGQGKTTVIDCVDFLLRGKNALPSGAITTGHDRGQVIGMFNGYTIERTINQDRGTTLKITHNGEPIKGKPQAFLDTFFNEISFNPMPFVSKKPDEKLKFLMEFAGIDLTEQNKKIAEYESQRTYVGREVKAFGKIYLPEKIEAVSVSELNKQLKENYISKEDLDLFTVTDDPKEAAQIMADFHRGKEFTPNF